MRTIIVSKSTTTGTGVVLIPNNTVTPSNLSEFRFIIACNINTPTADLPLYIQTTIGNVPILCKFGNTLYASQVNKRVNYPLIYGNQNENYPEGQFIIPSCNCISPRSTVVSTTTTTGESDNNTAEVNPNTRKK